MNRDIRRLRRYLEKPQPKNEQPFDRYAFNAFGWQAAYWFNHAKTEVERLEAARLRDVATQRSKAKHEN